MPCSHVARAMASGASGDPRPRQMSRKTREKEEGKGCGRPRLLFLANSRKLLSTASHHSRLKRAVIRSRRNHTRGTIEFFAIFFVDSCALLNAKAYKKLMAPCISGSRCSGQP